jgi:hypothetical protein
VVTFGYSGNYSATLLEDMWVPPHKSRSVKQTLCSSIFSKFNRVVFLDIRQALPACSTIFPLNTQVPDLGCFPHFIVASMLDVQYQAYSVKLRPLPQPHLPAHTFTEANPSAQRATQLRSVLARVCSVSRQNLNNCPITLVMT